MNVTPSFFSNRSRREKSLAAAIGAMLLLLAGTRGYNAFRQAVGLHQATLISAEQALSEAHVALLQGQRARHRMQQWRKASLPSNHDVARSLYQDWLHQEFTQAHLQVKELRDTTTGIGLSRSGQTADYRAFTFSVHAQGTLEELVQFLHRFYATPHLHRIASASLKPTPDRQALNLVLTIEAIAVPGCKRSGQLATDAKNPAAGIAAAAQEDRGFEQTLQTILERNVFTAYSPNQKHVEADSQAAASTKGAAQQALVSGMTLGGSGWRLAIRRQDTGRTLYFRSGDRIHIGQFEGTIASMDGRQVVIETATEKRTIRLGQSLAEGPVAP